MEDKEQTFMQRLSELTSEKMGEWSRHPYIRPDIEGIGGLVVVGLIASVVLSLWLSPGWLLVTIPGGILLLLHGLWRDGLL